MKKTKKLFTVLTALCLVLMQPAQVMAAVDLNAKYEVDTNKIQGWPQAADIASDTGILMDADTGTVLFDKGGDQQRSCKHHQDHDTSRCRREFFHG